MSDAADRGSPSTESLIEAMGAPGVEMIVGGRNDPEWGPVVVVGFGGVQAEILKDSRLLAPDMNDAEILAELKALKGAALLEGFRGSPPLDLEAIIAIVRAIGLLLLDEPSIREVDLNPVVIHPRGEGATRARRAHDRVALKRRSRPIRAPEAPASGLSSAFRRHPDGETGQNRPHQPALDQRPRWMGFQKPGD